MSFPRYPRYKDSGVEWLGEVPEHWEIRRVKHNLQLLTQKTSRREHPIGLENIESWTGRLIETESEFEGEGVEFEVDDLLFGKLRPYLAKVLVANAPGEAVGDFHVMRPIAVVQPRFVAYQFLTPEFISIVDSSTFGSKMPRANWDFIGTMMVTTPPKCEQEVIAAFLDRETVKIGALITEQRRLIELLKEKRQAVTSYVVTNGLTPSAPMKQSGVEWLGNVPAHWEVLRLKFLLAETKAGPFGSSLTKDMYVEAGYRVYGQEQVIPGNFSTGDYFISEEKFQELRHYSVSAGDILVSCVGTFGKVALVPNSIAPGIINPRLIRLRCEPNVSAAFLVEVLRSTVVFEQMSQLSRGGTMDVINIGTLNEIFVPLPPLSEQKAILAFLSQEVTRIDTLTAEAEHTIMLLQERRSALISAAVTGKIDVRSLHPSEAA